MPGTGDGKNLQSQARARVQPLTPSTQHLPLEFRMSLTKKRTLTEKKIAANQANHYPAPQDQTPRPRGGIARNVGANPLSL